MKDETLEEDINQLIFGSSYRPYIKEAGAKKNTAKNLYEFSSEHGATVNYIFGTICNWMMFCKKNSVPWALELTVVWNGLDAIEAIAIAYNKYKDKEDHHKKQRIAKIALNTFSGVQLLALTYNPILIKALQKYLSNNPAALASTSFAIAMGVDLICAALDWENARKQLSFEGWLEDKIDQINHLKSLNSEKGKAMLPELIQDVISRCKVHYNGEGEEEDLIDNALKKIHAEGIKELMLENATLLPRESDNNREKAIQAEVSQKFREETFNLTVRFSSFSGMSLFAALDFIKASSEMYMPLKVVALVMTGIASVAYVGRHTIKAYEKAKEIKEHALKEHGFFAASNDSEEGSHDKSNDLSVSELSDAAF